MQFSKIQPIYFLPSKEIRWLVNVRFLYSINTLSLAFASTLSVGMKDGLISDAFSYDAGYNFTESTGIIVIAIVKPETLLINVAKQMKRSTLT